MNKKMKTLLVTSIIYITMLGSALAKSVNVLK